MVNYWTLWDDKHFGFIRNYSSQEFKREEIEISLNFKDKGNGCIGYKRNMKVNSIRRYVIDIHHFGFPFKSTSTLLAGLVT